MKYLLTAMLMLALSSISFSTPTPIAAIGEKAPDFALTDLNGKTVKLSDYQGKIVVLEWINPGCPFVKGQYGSGNMQAIQKEATSKGVVWLTINSTRPDHPEAFNAAASKEILGEWKSNATNNLMDEDRTVGRLYGAKTTPHMFVIGSDGVLKYSGAIDDDRSADGGKKATVNYVREALNSIMANKAVAMTATAPYGCSVKY